MAAPEIKSLIGFPSTLKVFPRNGGFESTTEISGAQVLSLRTGTVVMRFEVPADWTFSNGQHDQQTSAPVTANQLADITMAYRLKTSLPDALDVRIRVIVRMADEASEEGAIRIQPVSYATLFDKLLNFFKFEKGNK